MLDAKAILETIPHRYPFLMVDRILEMKEDAHGPSQGVGLKNVTVTEEFFTGHFPGYPVMPGVLIIEAMAQVGGVVLLSDPRFKGKIPLMVGLDAFRFRHPVLPGDQLMISVELIHSRGAVGKMRGEAKVGEKVVCEGELMFALTERGEKSE